MRILLSICLCLLPAVGQAASALPHQPDPRTVQRFGPGYRYTQAGWTVVHIEGEPYARGVQHGRLLAPEIAAHLRSFAADISPKAPNQAWKVLRALAGAVFLRGHSREYLEEMKGIAAGASAAGARFDGRKIDLVDIVALNAWPEFDSLPAALNATPTGLEGLRLDDKPRTVAKPARCSAFAATGPATRDGKIVFGHITMFKLYPANFYNIWLDVKPTRGHRILMQSFPGGIHSGMDYYLNDAGLLVCETTIGQTRFDGKGAPLASRIRQAVQYADTIDKAVAVLLKDNNGLYTNEWLLGDIKTNEIAMLELGTHKTRLRRSSKDEWFGNTPGFYWGCNNTKDLHVRLETIASTVEQPRNAVFVPSERDKKWLELYDKHKGKIDADFGKLAFTTPPLAAFSSVDAKFTTSDMARRLESWALFGPPLGRTWQPRFSEQTDFPEIRPLVSNPWTVLAGAAPVPNKEVVRAVDQHDPAGSKLRSKSEEDREELLTTSAWHGTILPRSDADIWLASAFAAYERYVSREKALQKDKAELSEKARDKLQASLFLHQAGYEAGARARPEPTLLTIRRDLRQNDWHKVAEGKGVLLLHALRQELGASKFDSMMDDFGTAQAGKETTTQEFVACAEKAAGKKLDAFFTPWLKKTGLPTGRFGGPFSVLTFYPDLERTVIVYGTKDEEAANRAAAHDLRDALLRRGANIDVPIRSDQQVTPAELAGCHLLLVGRPATNRVAARLADQFPVTFGPASVRVRKEVYAHPDTALLAAGENPRDRRRSVVLIAGLGAASTVRAAGAFTRRDLPAGEVVILQHGKPAHALVIPARQSDKRDVAGGKEGR